MQEGKRKGSRLTSGLNGPILGNPAAGRMEWCIEGLGMRRTVQLPNPKPKGRPPDSQEHGIVPGEMSCTAEPILVPAPKASAPREYRRHRVGTSLSSQSPSFLPGAHVGGAAPGCA